MMNSFSLLLSLFLLALASCVEFKFNHCGAKENCRCTQDFKVMICSGVDLRRFPTFRRGVKPLVVKIILQFNRIERIREEDLARFEKLELLDLRNQKDIACVEVSVTTVLTGALWL